MRNKFSLGITLITIAHGNGQEAKQADTLAWCSEGNLNLHDLFRAMPGYAAVCSEFWREQPQKQPLLLPRRALVAGARDGGSCHSTRPVSELKIPTSGGRCLSVRAKPRKGKTACPS